MARRIERDVALVSERAAGRPVRESNGRFGGGQYRTSGASSVASPERRFNFHPVLDDLPEEQALTIEINGRPAATLVCSPIAIRELAVGWVFARGVVDGAAGIGRISEYPGRVSVMVDDATEIPGSGLATCAGRDAGRSPFGYGVAAPSPLVDLDIEPAERTGWTMERDRFLTVTESLFARLQSDRAAGNNHFAAATDGAATCIAARDLHMQNAIEKVIGWTVLQEHDRAQLMLCVTGQLTAALIATIWRAGFPLVVSTRAPTADAVDLAEAAGMTIVGCMLEPDRSVYCHGWRLPAGDDDQPAISARHND
ncbi:MAG TPA: formate dehydrogenase accessory sulfurtransferase FdhD [Thermomicrobiales bacterium]|nr:formate dehydrogenase accessory sulfurtransferase FdhD [Thermomicrobiales bacterium]